MRDEMTIPEVLRDPLIRQMLRADRISLGAFAALLAGAALTKGKADPMRPTSMADDAQRAVA